jgi:hypothetical protein
MGQDPGTEAGEEDVTRTTITRKAIADELAWAVLFNRASEADMSASGEDASSNALSRLLGLVSTESKTSKSQVIPLSTLDLAPHLADLEAAANVDEHLEKTRKLRAAYGADKATDPVIDLMQAQRLREPLPRAIWKLVVLDKYVDFEKLHASQQQGFDYNYDTRDDLGGSGFALVKKDHITSRRSVQTEAEWKRLYSGWIAAVLLLYPHRREELDYYHDFVDNLFRTAPNNPSSGICFDAAVRDRYAKEPFRMDDLARLLLFMVSHMLAGSSKTGRGSKRPSTTSENPSNKRMEQVCENWNLGICKDPCKNRRKHGVCSECGQSHAANTVNGCIARLKERRNLH